MTSFGQLGRGWGLLTMLWEPRRLSYNISSAGCLLANGAGAVPWKKTWLQHGYFICFAAGSILLFFQYFYTFLAAANNYLRTSVSVSHGFRCICVQLAARVSADKKAGKVKEAKARLKCSLWRKHFAKHFARHWHWHWLHHPAVVIYKIWAYIYVHVYFGKLSVVQDSGGKRTRSGRERKVYDGNAADSWIINLARLFDFSRFHIASLSIWLGSVLVSWLTQTQHKRRTTTADIDTFRVARRRRKNRLRFIYIKAKISNNPHAKLKENALRNT